jgi:hypothetical protein
MKEKNIVLAPAVKYNKLNQCKFKKPYKLKRRAIVDARELSKCVPGEVFTVYECPHCGKYHVGKVRKE